MRENITQTLNFYSVNEMNLFKSSPVFLELDDLSKQKGFIFECSLGFGKDDKNNFYMGFRVIDKNGNPVLSSEYDDFADLSDATCIIEIDKKERIKFFSWEEDDEFMESLNWALTELNKK